MIITENGIHQNICDLKMRVRSEKYKNSPSATFRESKPYEFLDIAQWFWWSWKAYVKGDDLPALSWLKYLPCSSKL